MIIQKIIFFSILCLFLCSCSNDKVPPNLAIPIIKKSLPYNLSLRRIAPRVLENWPSDDTRQILLTLLQDPDEEVAQNAAFYLGKIGGVEVYQPLVKAISHKSPMVRHNALNALNYLGQSDLALEEAIIRINDLEESHYVVDSAIDLMKKVDHFEKIDKATLALKAFENSTTDENYKFMAQRAITIINMR